MPSDTSIQQSLLDTIERPFYQQLPSDSQEPESQKADLHPPEKDQGIGAASGHPYQPHPITPERLERTKKALPPQPGQQRQHHHHHDIFGRPTSGLIFLLRWGCAILTAAATILFGVWAPLSYQATKEANKDNDEIQRALMRSAKSANEIASSALYAASQQLDIATAQASVISNLQDQLAAMGQVVLLQFCNAQTRGVGKTILYFIATEVLSFSAASCNSQRTSLHRTWDLAQPSLPPPNLTVWFLRLQRRFPRYPCPRQPILPFTHRPIPLQTQTMTIQTQTMAIHRVDLGFPLPPFLGLFSVVLLLWGSSRGT